MKNLKEILKQSHRKKEEAQIELFLTLIEKVPYNRCIQEKKVLCKLCATYYAKYGVNYMRNVKK